MARSRALPSLGSGTGTAKRAICCAALLCALVLALAATWPPPGYAQHQNANATPAGNLTGNLTGNATGMDASAPLATDTAAGHNSTPGAATSGETEKPSASAAPQSTARGVETRGAMPERNAAPGTAEKPAPDAADELSPIPGGKVGWSGYFQALGAIFLIIAVLAGGFFLLKRFGPRAVGGGVFGRGTLQLEAQLPLGPRKSIAVVRFLNKRLVLGVTDSNITLLTETETKHDDEVPEHISPAQSGGSAFSKMLAKARNPRA
ncbi:MAG: flagellar biosynthetic protein FliO [Oceanidesulfovibrio sp.]